MKVSRGRLVAVVLGIAVAGWYGWHRYRLATAPYEWSGTVEARTISLGSRAGGRIKELPVRSGDFVKAGTALARVETTPLELRLAQARSQLRTPQLRVEALKSGPRPEDVAQAEAAVSSAQGKLTDLQSGSLPQDIAQATAALLRDLG